jgi:aminopeptidase N
VQILPRKEQSFTITVDSKPLLVNFDYRGTLIKELEFDKTTEELAYQLTRDDDVLGRVWALGQLAGRVNSGSTAEAEKQRIASELASAVTRDKFWGVRADAATALGSIKGASARDALVAATRDADARVRAHAVTSLAASKDPAPAKLFEKLLNDKSYAVIKAAALALGETRSAGAYEALSKLLLVPSWRDNIKASALSGLGELEDKRALPVALRYAAKGNPPQVRTAALKLLGKVGTGSPEAFTLIAEMAPKAFAGGDFNLATAAGEALVSLGDPRGVAVLEQINKDPAVSARRKEQLREYQERLRKAVAGTSNPGTRQP